MVIRLKEADVQKLSLVREIILRDVRVHYTLPQLSALSQLNTFKLKKGFKMLYGQSIYDFLQSQRMELALQLLTATDDPIQDIADRCGYGYSTNFIAVFRRKFKIKPTHYRRSQSIGKSFISHPSGKCNVSQAPDTLYPVPRYKY